MLPRKHSDRIRVAFDDHRLVANAGLLLPPASPCAWVWVWVSWWANTLTWGMPLAGPTLATS